MTLHVGPAVGAKGQVGLAEEGAWGCQSQEMTNFIEMTSESIVSEIGSLVSGALRSDRATHKRIGGVEAAGGDVNCEVGPSGFETWFKHALGEVETTRLDKAFVLECTNPNETNAVLSITQVAGLATELKVDMVVGADLTLDLTNASYDTIGEVMTAINAHANLAAWSPYQATQGVWQTSLDATNDYCASGDNSNRLEELADIELIKSPDRRWVVSTEWGCFSHQIQCAQDLPPGMSIEVGRDVAAFLYSGMKINTMELNATPGEFFAGTFGLMGKGGTTSDTPAAASANAGNAKNAFKIRYVGEQASATLEIDSSNSVLVLEIDATTEDVVLNINEPYVDPETGIVYNVNRIGGIVDYLDDLSYIDCQIADYTDPRTLTTSLDNYPATDITSSDYVWFNFESDVKTSLPVLWGDYIGSDSGDSVTFHIKVTGAGVPGVAKLQFQKAGGGYGNECTTSATVSSEVRTGANVDSGYDVFFPDNTELQLDDIWSFETIRPSSDTDYSDIDPYSGYEGSLEIDGATQPIMGWTCTVNNNLYGDKYHLGERVRAKLPEQKRTVEGTVNVEFDDLDLYRRFLNGTQGDLIMEFTSAEYIETTALGNSATQFGMTIRQPEIEFNGATPTIADEGIITVDMPYVALWDDDNNIPELRTTIVSDVPYI